jgi:hypothetical protein
MIQEEISAIGSIETLGPALDKYEIADFARDDWPRFAELVNLLNPRDQEIMLLYAVLQKRPTELSILFGKAGHRAEEDLHKSAHKLAGLAEFGPIPSIDRIDAVLKRAELAAFGNHSLGACLWQYARCRDFAECATLMGHSGLRQHMLRTFKQLHATNGREEGLLAGWILWLVDGSDPHGKGWRKRKRGTKDYKLGPTVFRSQAVAYGDYKPDGSRPVTTMALPPADGRGGRGQRAAVVKIKRHMKFVLRGMNA